MNKVKMLINNWNPVYLRKEIRELESELEIYRNDLITPPVKNLECESEVYFEYNTGCGYMYVPKRLVV